MYFGAVTFNVRFPDEIAAFPATSTGLWVFTTAGSTVVVFVHASVVIEVEVLVPPGVVPPSSVPEVEFNSFAVAIMDSDGSFPFVSTAEFVKEIVMEPLAPKLFTVIVPLFSVAPNGSDPVPFRKLSLAMSLYSEIALPLLFLLPFP